MRPPYRVRIQQDFHQQARMIGRGVTDHATIGPQDEPQVQLLDQIRHEGRQMVGGQPLLRRGRQQPAVVRLIEAKGSMVIAGTPSRQLRYITYILSGGPVQEVSWANVGQAPSPLLPRRWTW
jgi:hypothetical protein